MKEKILFSLITPLSILLASAFITDAIRSNTTTPSYAAAEGQAHEGYPEAPPSPQTALKTDLDADEYILGNPNAETFIVEYSDIDCPFCARVHPTLEQVVEESDNAVAWVFRHFPLEQLHPDARRKAIATECVGKLAGNDSFWLYLDRLFKQEPTSIYTDYNISQVAFESCMEDPKTLAAIQADIDRATESGGRGTPYSIVSNSEKGLAVSGALPIASWKATIDAINN